MSSVVLGLGKDARLERLGKATDTKFSEAFLRLAAITSFVTLYLGFKAIDGQISAPVVGWGVIGVGGVGIYQGLTLAKNKAVGSRVIAIVGSIQALIGVLATTGVLSAKTLGLILLADKIAITAIVIIPVYMVSVAVVRCLS